jgi:RNA polymerase sigma factor (TIGR02999 family)
MRSDVTQILAAIDSGDPKASEALLPLVYEELRTLAARRMANEAAGHTLQATALVHEAYVRLVGPQGAQAGRWDCRGHFFAAAAEAMRRVLIDRARAKKRDKRGGAGGRKRFDLSTADLAIEAGADGGVPDEILDLDDALQKLAAEDPVKAELVKLRFFGGMSMWEAAEFLGISTTTGDRYWAYARAFLFAEMRDNADGEA